MHPVSGTHLLNGCRSHFLPFFGYSPVMHTKHSLVISIPRQLLYGQETRQLSRVWESPGPGSSYMGNMQYAILFKQRSQRLPSMINFPFITKMILYVQLATLCSHKTSQNMGFFNKIFFRGPRFFVPERGPIDKGGHDSSFRGGGALAWGGALARGGGSRSFLQVACKGCEHIGAREAFLPNMRSTNVRCEEFLLSETIRAIIYVVVCVCGGRL